MTWLDVPHLRQNEPGWCLPACVAMVAAYWQQPVTQADVARWLGTRGGGTPTGRIQQMSRRGFEVTYNTGSLADLETWLQRQIPPILFIRTGDLPHWTLDTPHAVVLAGLTETEGYLFDPDVETAPVTVPLDALLLAWSPFDYTYATLFLP